MNEDEDVNIPTDRTGFLQSLYADVASATEKKKAAEKAMVAPEGPMGGGDAFAQILTSVLPTLLGAAIAGKRGGMVGADVGMAANENMFSQNQKRQKEKEAAAKVQYQEAVDLEKAARAKASSGVEGMFRDEMSDRRMAHQGQMQTNALMAAMERSDKNIAAAMDRAELKEKGQTDRANAQMDRAQSKLSIPGTTVKTNPDTGKPFAVDEGEHDRTSKMRDAYYGVMPQVDRLRTAIRAKDTQEQVAAYSALTSAMKDYYGYGGALVDSERVLTQAGLPPIGDPASAEGISRFFKGKVRGADLEKVLDTFINTLSSEVKMKGGKYDFKTPPPAGTPVLYKGQKAVYAGTFDEFGKPTISLVR